MEAEIEREIRAIACCEAVACADVHESPSADPADREQEEQDAVLVVLGIHPEAGVHQPGKRPSFENRLADSAEFGTQSDLNFGTRPERCLVDFGLKPTREREETAHPGPNAVSHVASAGSRTSGMARPLTGSLDAMRSVSMDHHERGG